ncbi:MAG TPA: DNA replication protein [Dongiaceae bacterium]|nr:DNA replication protein [Dongiaceae bacterium]
MAQLPLELGHRASYDGDDFLVASCNQAAVAWLDRWPAWPGPGLAVHGPPGCGKTHLAHVFLARADARLLRLADLEEPGPPALLQRSRAWVLDDMPPLPEQALLHFYNGLAEAGGHLLIVSRLPPARWDLRLPDLGSRLAALPAVRIEPPDDDLMEALLVKHFADRQIAVAPGVVAYLRTRLERSFASVARIVDALDRESLARRRAVSLVLAREVIERETP